MLALLLLLQFPGSSPVLAELNATEYGVKAAFLYNFTDYVEWPSYRFANAQSPFVFGVHDAGELAEDLKMISLGRTVQGRPIEVREISGREALEDVHVLFIGGEAGTRDARLLAEAVQEATLTVTEATRQQPADSAIHFRVIEGKVRFDVSLTVAEAARLSISSRLLNVARRIRGIQSNPSDR